MGAVDLTLDIFQSTANDPKLDSKESDMKRTLHMQYTDVCT